MGNFFWHIGLVRGGVKFLNFGSKMAKRTEDFSAFMLQMSKNAIKILKFIVEVISFYNKYDDQKDND